MRSRILLHQVTLRSRGLESNYERRPHLATVRPMTRGVGRRNRTTGVFGSVDKLATGYRARYYGPDRRRYKAPTLFLTQCR